MLPQEYQLKRMKDWEILFKEGYFVSGSYLTLKVWKIQPDKYPRRGYTPSNLLIGFAVGLKISKSAVKRNRVKRQMREVVRLLLKGGQVKSGFMVGVIAKPQVLDKEYGKIEAEIMSLFKKAKLII